MKNTTGWALLLPFLDQAPAYNQYNFDVCSSCSSPYGHPTSGDDSLNATVISERISVFECPSDVSAGEVSSYGAGGTSFYARREARRTSYLFATGVFTDYNASWRTYASDVRRGAFGNDGAAKMRDLIDGSSNTILVGEATGGGNKTSTHYGPWGLTGTHTCCHGRVVSSSSTAVAEANFAPYQAQWHINASWTPTDPLKKTYAWVFGSKHVGGAHFLLGDGSVRLLSENMNYRTFGLLNYIADNQPIGEF